MYYDVVDARHIEGYRIALTFEDGKKGVVDLKDYAAKGGIFSRFKDLGYFRRLYVNKDLGALCWPEGLDIAPEPLYHEATFEPLPYWMSSV